MDTTTKMTIRFTQQKAVTIFDNGGQFLVFAEKVGDAAGNYEYWFTVGKYATVTAARRWAIKKMAAHGCVPVAA